MIQPMTTVSFETKTGQTDELLMPLPNYLDPRFDFARSDERLAEVHAERLAIVSDLMNGASIVTESVRFLTHDPNAAEFIENPTAVERS